MTTFHDIRGEDNVARLNAFLTRFPDDIDPDFDDTGEELERQLAEYRLSFGNR